MTGPRNRVARAIGPNLKRGITPSAADCGGRRKRPLQRATWRFGIIAVASLVLAACASPQVRIINEDGTQRIADDTDFTQDPFKAQPDTQEAPRDSAAGGGGTTAWNTPDVGPEPIPEIGGDPRNLVGLSNGAILSLLGVPALIRREQQVEVWQFGDDTCVLDLFLVQDESVPDAQRRQRSTTVRYFEARDRKGQPTDVEPCFERLLAARGLV